MIEIEPLGDRALTVRLGDSMDMALAALARHVASRLRTVPGVLETVSGYCTITVFYERESPSIRGDIERTVAMATDAATDNAVTGTEHIIPVRYDGPDLDDVAKRTGLSVADVIERHAGRVYTAYLIGFVPGWAYLGDLDPVLALPRRDEPRTRVPAGSVAIAGRQTGVYPLDTPGGWHLIGHTSATMFDPSADPPATLAAGDRVRFVPTTE
ncbi:MAG TPA: 5-oxoprolinase subunit PxpB [Gemmatimonadaceae bacterium]|nr:5-oxoprolinase subunit PxpB [Gemmatimonadaceae bacterium]